MAERGRKGGLVTKRRMASPGLDPEELRDSERTRTRRTWLETVWRPGCDGPGSQIARAHAAIRAVGEWVKAEALLVEQMSQGTPGASVCFLPSTLVLREYGIFRGGCPFQLNLCGRGKAVRKLEDGKRKRWFRHPGNDYSLQGDSSPAHHLTRRGCCAVALVRGKELTDRQPFWTTRRIENLPAVILSTALSLSR